MFRCFLKKKKKRTILGDSDNDSNNNDKYDDIKIVFIREASRNILDSMRKFYRVIA